ncbi:MAG: hypothetical protein WC076_06400 [Terrimicrobiaceae bacterium]|jgi:hypothetical protein|nr:hypothetical protein [Terrimicrobiaceae bacterium]
MRGEPKGIRRKIAKEKKTIREKMAVSTHGDIGEYPNIVNLCDSIHLAAWIQGHLDEKKPLPGYIPKCNGVETRC